MTSGKAGSKLRSDEIIAEENGESRKQVQRYIRLTYLIPDLLQMVDESKISLTPALELSYLPEKAQTCLLEEIHRNDCTPSLSQAVHLKREYQAKTLTVPKLRSIMVEEKAIQRENSHSNGTHPKLFPTKLYSFSD